MTSRDIGWVVGSTFVRRSAGRWRVPCPRRQVTSERRTPPGVGMFSVMITVVANRMSTRERPAAP